MLKLAAVVALSVGLSGLPSAAPMQNELPQTEQKIPPVMVTIGFIKDSTEEFTTDESSQLNIQANTILLACEPATPTLRRFILCVEHQVSTMQIQHKFGANVYPIPFMILTGAP